jgi:hypothetical protein
MAALSQLSYSPKGVFGGKSYRHALVVPGWLEAKVHMRLAFNVIDRQRKYSIQFRDVDREEIDLIGRVSRSHVAVRGCVPACADMGRNDVASDAPPLALHS